MAKFYGVRTEEAKSSVATPDKAETGICIAFGTAPVHQVGGSANEVIAVNSYEEAVAAVGYSDNWDKYTLCEVIYSHFKLYGMAPLLLVNVMDPAENQEDEAEKSYTISGGKVVLDEDAIADTIVVKGESSTTYKAGTDYDVVYSDGACIIEVLAGGAIESAKVSSVKVSYKKVSFELSDMKEKIIGGYDVSTGVSKGLELMDLAFFKTGVLPDILIAPGFSADAEIAAVMANKTEFSSVFKGSCFCDMETTTANVYNKAITAKQGEESFRRPRQVICWPKVKKGDKIYHLSTQLAGLQCSVDMASESVPSRAASNHVLQADSAVLADGTEVLMDITQANALRENGFVTAVSMLGEIRAWGAHNACVPDNDDPKDMMIHTSRMLAYINNYAILTFWDKVDEHITARYAEAIVDELGSWLDNLTANGHLYGARCELKKEENSLDALAKGIIKIHIYLAVPRLASEVDFVIEYDSSYIESALSEILA